MVSVTGWVTRFDITHKYIKQKCSYYPLCNIFLPGGIITRGSGEIVIVTCVYYADEVFDRARLKVGQVDRQILARTAQAAVDNYITEESTATCQDHLEEKRRKRVSECVCAFSF